MIHFIVDDLIASNASCQKCCCEKLSLKPGTITKISIGYAPWAVPIGQLHCAPQFQLEQLETCALATTGNFPPQVATEVKFSTAANTSVDGDLKTKTQDLEGDTLTYKVLPLYGPKYGKLTLNPNGLFNYVPAMSFVGEERFYVSVSDGINAPVKFEVMIAVGIDPAAMHPTPHISVGPPTVDNRYYMVSFPVVVTPAAQECEVWRLTVLQTAIDCACICYSRSDCYDIAVATC